MLHHRPEVHLAPAERGIGTAAGGALGGLGTLALHRGREAREVVLHEVVVRAGLHRGDGVRLVDGARDEDERYVEAALVQTGQRLDRVELREPVVGNDHVPRRGQQSLLEALGGIDAVKAHQPPLGLERVHDERRVRLRILDQEDAERAAGGSREGSHEGRSGI